MTSMRKSALCESFQTASQPNVERAAVTLTRWGVSREGCEPGFAGKGIGHCARAQRGRSATLGDSLARRGPGLGRTRADLAASLTVPGDWNYSSMMGADCWRLRSRSVVELCSVPLQRNGFARGVF